MTYPDAAKTGTKSVQLANNYCGLSGWLAFVGFGLIVALCLYGRGAYTIAVLFADGTVRLMSDTTSSVSVPGYSAALRFELAGQMLLALGSAYALCLYFLKHYLFPRVYILTSVSALAFLLVDLIVGSALARTSAFAKEVFEPQNRQLQGQMLGTAVGTTLWVAYMVQSRRVRATFGSAKRQAESPV